jgi:hypothetical protein
MIPYDDLVAALTAWRTRQGLPVARTAVAAPPIARTPAAPPAARPAPASDGDFEDSALIEDGSYDASGDDYVMQLGEPPGEPTAIGAAPEPPGKRKRW